MHRNAPRLILELLEGRTLLATCHVTRLSDVGAGMGFRGDLRYCINKVNAEPGADAIDFNVTGVIKLSGPLPALASDVQIRGPGSDLLFVRRDTDPDYSVFTVAASATVQILRLTVLGGLSLSGGGGIFNEGNLTLNQVNVTQNVSVKKGGGIFNKGTLTVLNSSITQNISLDNSTNPPGLAQGGGVYNDTEGVAIIAYSEVSKNSAEPQVTILKSAEGAGIYNKGSMTLNYSAVTGNSAFALGEGVSARGGGVYNAAGGTLIVSSSSFAQNEAVIRAGGTSFASGGAVFNAGIAKIDNSTITENFSAEGGTGNHPLLMSGAGIHNEVSLTISHSTIARNKTIGDTGYEAGGGIFAASPPFVENSIIALNSADTEGPDVWGALNSNGYNIIGDPSGGSGYHEFDLLNVDPMLGLLADNGGPTLSLALLPSSPAIDAGNNTDAAEFDQRGPGFPRIVNDTIDIGAFEVQATEAPSLPNILAFLITADSDND